VDEAHVVGLEGCDILPLRGLAVQVELLEALEPGQQRAVGGSQQVRIGAVLVERVEGVVANHKHGSGGQGAAIVLQHLHAQVGERSAASQDGALCEYVQPAAAAGCTWHSLDVAAQGCSLRHPPCNRGVSGCCLWW
jgi:hypothetical protein